MAEMSEITMFRNEVSMTYPAIGSQQMLTQIVAEAF